MKKLILALISICSMMIFIASPLFIKPIKANAATSLGIADDTTGTYYFVRRPNIINHYSNNADVYYMYLSTFDNNTSSTMCVIFDDCTECGENIRLADNNIWEYGVVNPTLNGNPAPIFTRRRDAVHNQIDYLLESHIQSGYIGMNITQKNGLYWSKASFLRTENNMSETFTQSETYVYQSPEVTTPDNDYIPSFNIPDNALSLNLEVSFSPSMSGSVTRQGTSNGSSITYNYLDLNIQNHGDNAQWLFAIVPHGQSLTFPESILNTPQGFNGSVSYVYIADEWIDWTNGLTGMTGNFGGIDMQMLYSPCAWHTLITHSDRTYHINWDMMKLSKNVSYDCVVYGMINEEPVNASASGSGLGCWTVKSALSDIQEVYRSTFTMSNPPTFNPNSVDEGNSSHPWDPDIDNSGIFNTGNVYKDSNGNFVIKGGSSNSNSSGGSFYVPSSSVNNINNIFRNFFRFISGVLICFPSVYQNIIALGLSALIVVGVVKVAIK